MTHLTSETQLEEEKSPSLSIGQRCKQMFARFLKPSTLESAQLSIAAFNDAISDPLPQNELPEPERATVTEPVGGLSPESPISMSRIQGALGEHWNAAKGLFIRIHQQQTSAWASVPSRPAALIQDKPAGQPIRLNKPPQREEEVRGLDDLFPKQITDFFMEDSKSSANMGMTSPIQEAKRKEVIRFDESLIRKVRWPECGKTISKTPPTLLEMPAEAAMGTVEEPEPNAPTMIFENGVASMEDIELPVADQVECLSQIEDLALENAIEPEALQSVEIAAAASDFVPDWFIVTETALVATEATTPQVVQKPVQPLSIVRKPLAQEQEEVDMSSLDYMARNNRILGNSISFLVDRYFQQAALEESLKAY